MVQHQLTEERRARSVAAFIIYVWCKFSVSSRTALDGPPLWGHPLKFSSFFLKSKKSSNDFGLSNCSCLVCFFCWATPPNPRNPSGT